MSMRKPGFIFFLSLIIFLLFWPSSCNAIKNNSKSKVSIENVDTKTLEELVESEKHFVVFFYTKICRACDKVLQELENIYHGHNFTWKFVKHDEMVVPKSYGVKKFPSLVYFNKKEPVIYDGDLSDKESVDLWLRTVDNSTSLYSLEELSAKTLQTRIDDSEYIAVLFYTEKEGASILQTLRVIGDEAHSKGVPLYQITDLSIAAEFGFESLPALVSYRNKEPHLYEGNIADEQEILKWLLRYSEELSNLVEDISGPVLESLIENSTYLAVLFCM